MKRDALEVVEIKSNASESRYGQHVSTEVYATRQSVIVVCRKERRGISSTFKDISLHDRELIAAHSESERCERGDV